MDEVTAKALTERLDRIANAIEDARSEITKIDNLVHRMQDAIYRLRRADAAREAANSDVILGMTSPSDTTVKKGENGEEVS